MHVMTTQLFIYHSLAANFISITIRNISFARYAPEFATQPTSAHKLYRLNKKYDCVDQTYSIRLPFYLFFLFQLIKQWHCWLSVETRKFMFLTFS
jgi:hypothetical protein